MTKTTLADWEDYLEMVAHLVIEDPVYIPIFKRIEAEIARVTEEEDVIARARKIAAMPAKQGLGGIATWADDGVSLDLREP